MQTRARNENQDTGGIIADTLSGYGRCDCKGGADKAMSTLDEAIEYVSGVRSRIGAFQNRLESAESSLSETSENMTGAYSNIMDTDMATEMTEYAAQNILDQAESQCCLRQMTCHSRYFHYCRGNKQ